MYVAGIDVGSVAAKAVVLELLPNGGSQVAGRAVLPTGWNTAEAGEFALNNACEAAAMARSDLRHVTATGLTCPQKTGPPKKLV